VLVGLERIAFTATFAAIGVACAASSFAAASAVTPHAALTPAQRASIDALVRRTMAAQKIPGISVEVAVGGHTLYARGFGTRSAGAPVTPATVFAVGSITKQFTAACVVMLAEQRSLDLDAPVSRYLAHVPHGDEVTVRELLDQTSGLADYTAQPALQAAVGKDKLTDVTPARLLAMIAQKRLAFQPGARFAYSNTNYLVAGMIVEAVSGEPLGTFLREHVAAPAGMRDMQYLTTSIPDGANVARGYSPKKGRVVAAPRFTMSWARGAGALASTARDLVAWDDAFFHGRIVSPASVRMMTTAVKSDYGYGWVVEPGRGERMIWHNGEIPGVHAMNAYFPGSDLAIVVLTNLGGSKPEDLAKQIKAVVSRR
jgi:CubicO group peptidase (beta-lactamase class C family)